MLKKQLIADAIHSCKKAGIDPQAELNKANPDEFAATMGLIGLAQAVACLCIGIFLGGVAFLLFFWDKI